MGIVPLYLTKTFIEMPTTSFDDITISTNIVGPESSA